MGKNFMVVKFCNVRTGQKVSEVGILNLLCQNMIAHGPKPLKNFKFLNFEFSYPCYGSFSFGYFNNVGFD